MCPQETTPFTKAQTEDALEVRVAGRSGQAVFTPRFGKGQCRGLSTKVLSMAWPLEFGYLPRRQHTREVGLWVRFLMALCAGDQHEKPRPGPASIG